MNIAESFEMGFSSITSNKLRAFLTILGIVFGVGAVISMLAIGEGAQKEIIDQLALTGVNNIVIKSKPITTDPSEKNAKPNFSGGLQDQDIETILNSVPYIKKIAPEVEAEYEAIYGLNHKKVKLVGTNEHYASMFNFELLGGKFILPYHIQRSARVCVIGEDVKRNLFKTENPVGKFLKVGPIWLEVIGVVAPKKLQGSKSAEGLGVRNYTMDVYIPTTTFILRYLNRDNVKSQDNNNNNNQENSQPQQSLPQLDKITVQVTQTEYLKPVRDLLERLLSRLHYNSKDFEIIVPQELLNQQQKTKQIFNIVLGCIGGISLLVGGIGIMNIMLATVTERTKEIGIRRAIGATKQDIIFQFMIEALVLCIVGGVIGVVFGYLIAFIISTYADIKTIVSLFSIVVSFTVATMTGLVFGLYPARKAAEKDPVESLRYE